ncbi:MAG TPA: ABC transporter ATP-binding protein [Gaiellaceae bacterium]|nr:ABC transporter ATP-binding protein [Gaiellaceae bacterium]
MPDPILELHDITKRFDQVVALAGVDFDLFGGEVHTVLGENGAGKSTLMSILSGASHPDTGTFLVRGEPVSFRSPRDGFAHGIGMVHQHYQLVRTLTAAENLHIGWAETPLLVNRKRLIARAQELVSKYELGVNVSRRVADMSVGEQQRAEILRTLVRGANIIILDEPTAALAPQEAEGLFDVIRNLVGDGKSVIFISHKLAEVMSISSRITVLRRGKNMGTLAAKDADELTLTRMMVGRDVINRMRPTGSARAGETILVADDLFALDDDGSLGLQGASLSVRAGEIVGVAGVAGNGQRELSEALTGLRKITAGKITIGGTDLSNANPRAFLAAGVGHIPEDRYSVGLAGNESIETNAILKAFERPPIARGPFIVQQESRRFAKRLLEHARVEAKSISARVRQLSGGNAQRLLVGREVLNKPRLLVACHPTRGLDVAAMAEVQRHLSEARAQGLAVLLIGEDLDELVALADRIVVMFEGRIIDEFSSANVDLDTLGLRMAGSLADADSESTKAGARGTRH